MSFHDHLPDAPVKVLQVISGLPNAHGGPTYSVPRLSQAASTAGIVCEIHCDEKREDLASSKATYSYPRDFERIPGLRRFNFSSSMEAALLDRYLKADIIHNHGLWRMANVYAGRAARLRNIPLVVSPRGMVGEVPLEFSSASKIWFWRMLQGSAMSDAALWHATSFAEAEEIRQFGIRAPIAIVPNGVDLPPNSATPLQPRNKTLLFLSRIHPKKGLHVLLATWARLAAGYPDWNLRIVGPGEPRHLRETAEQIRHFNAPRVSLEGPIYGSEKWRVYREASLYILPTLNENFGITTAEALACCTPAIVTKGAPWEGLETHGCGWWIDFGEPALEAALRQAFATPSETLAAMGARGEDWVREAFSWDSVGSQMAQTYLWLCGQGSRPSFVYLS
jgi:glycosyltransferase involved in cell wall biosynthesis